MVFYGSMELIIHCSVSSKEHTLLKKMPDNWQQYLLVCCVAARRTIHVYKAIQYEMFGIIETQSITASAPSFYPASKHGNKSLRTTYKIIQTLSQQQED